MHLFIHLVLYGQFLWELCYSKEIQEAGSSKETWLVVILNSSFVETVYLSLVRYYTNCRWVVLIFLVNLGLPQTNERFINIICVITLWEGISTCEVSESFRQWIQILREEQIPCKFNLSDRFYYVEIVVAVLHILLFRGSGRPTFSRVQMLCLPKNL